MNFASPFDKTLAHTGPAAVFLPDPEGAFRMEPSWTRDCWGRAPGPHSHGWTWTLLRDRASGFVVLALVTSPSLLCTHPRLDVRTFGSLEEAQAAQAQFGAPPVSVETW